MLKFNKNDGFNLRKMKILLKKKGPDHLIIIFIRVLAFKFIPRLDLCDLKFFLIKIKNYRKTILKIHQRIESYRPYVFS